MIAITFPLVLSNEDKLARIQAALAAGPVYVHRGDGLNDDKVTGVRLRSGAIWLETKHGWQCTSSVPFFGRTQRTVW